MQYLPGAPIPPFSYTRHQLLAEAIALLKEKVQAYMRRPEYPASLQCKPREAIDGLIFETAEETHYGEDGDDRVLLSLAVEDPALARSQPKTFEADALDCSPPWPEYMIRTNFEEWIAEQLGRYAQMHPLCCEGCGREPATWLWFPQRANGPEWMAGAYRLSIGEQCKALLDRGDVPPMISPDWPVSLACISPLPVVPEDTYERAAFIGTVPLDYRPLSQRLQEAEQRFDIWLASAATEGAQPAQAAIGNAIAVIAVSVIPDQFGRVVDLVLLAMEAPHLAEWRSKEYDILVEGGNEEITAALLLWCALVDHVSARLRDRYCQRSTYAS